MEPNLQATPQSASAQIQLENISLSYFAKPRWLGGKPFYALKGINLDIDKQNLAIVGPSGAGKSSLIELLFGLKKPTTGEVFICGRSLTHCSHEQKKALCRHIQLVPQEPQSSLNPYFTVNQILLEPLVNTNQAGPEQAQLRIQRVMQDVGLDLALLAKNSQALSVGQAQRVAIARALILEPCVLVADEPTSALDPISRTKIIALFSQLQRIRKMRLVLVTHDIDAAKKLCDDILVLDQGEIVEHDSTANISQCPSHPVTKALLASSNHHAVFKHN